MIRIIRTDSENTDFRLLVVLLDAELRETYGDLQNTYDNYNKIEQYKNVIVAFENKIPVGCGCFKAYDTETAEVKRMFVHKNFRGKGISKVILQELEKWMIEKNIHKSVLETGIKQNKAIHLYLTYGYHKIDNYGHYTGIESSVCMSKEL